MVEPAPANYPGCPHTVDRADAAGQALRIPRWGLWDVLITLAGTWALAIIAGLLLFAFTGSLPIQILVGSSVPWIFLAGWPLLSTKLRGNGARIDLGISLTWADAGLGALGGLAALVLAAGAAMLTSLVFGDFSSLAGDAAGELQQQGSRWTLLLFILMIVVVAPMVEELAFRGLFFAALRKRGEGPVVTIVVTAVAFAVFHLEPTRLGVLLCVGLVLGFVRFRTGSVGASMVAHGVVNAPAALFVLFGLPGMAP